MSDDEGPMTLAGRNFLDQIDKEMAHVKRDQTRALLRNLRHHLCQLECNAWAAEVGAGMDGCIIGMMREGARRVTGANCAFADDDLGLLTDLADRAVKAGLTEGLHPSVLKSIAGKVKESGATDEIGAVGSPAGDRVATTDTTTTCGR